MLTKLGSGREVSSSSLPPQSLYQLSINLSAYIAPDRVNVSL